MHVYLIPCGSSLGCAVDRESQTLEFRCRALGSKCQMENGSLTSGDSRNAMDAFRSNDRGSRCRSITNRYSIANSRFMRVVKVSRRFQVFSDIGKDDNLLQRRRRFLSSATLRNFAAPESTFALRAASTSPCHSGDSMSCCSLESEAQSHSIA